jgi:hypothetical protein
MTTVPLGCAAGSHQPEIGTPSDERKATSSEASPNEAGVRPAFSLVGELEATGGADAGEEPGHPAEGEGEQRPGRAREGDAPRARAFITCAPDPLL